MITKIKADKLTSPAWLPMGQRVLRAGYRRITVDEIRTELGDERVFDFERHGTKFYKWKSARFHGDGLTRTTLDKWLEPIPPAALALISKAHEIGFRDMTVYEIAALPDDPMVAAEWNDELWFIARWGNEGEKALNIGERFSTSSDRR